MSRLKSLEDRLAGLVEGAFGRAFRSRVQPVELARKLAREMDEHRSVSLSRTYVPNEFNVYLSSQDRAQFADFEEALASDLAGHLLEHARNESYALVSRPAITFHTDERLGLGAFGIQARVVSASTGAEAPAPAEAGRTMVYSTADRARAPLEEPGPSVAPPRPALLRFNGRSMPISPRGSIVGRSRDCDVVLPDSNVSRQHARVRREGDTWLVSDLGSTNGVRVGGRHITGEQPLRPGDLIEVGTSELSFELE